MTFGPGAAWSRPGCNEAVAVCSHRQELAVDPWAPAPEPVWTRWMTDSSWRRPGRARESYDAESAHRIAMTAAFKVSWALTGEAHLGCWRSSSCTPYCSDYDVELDLCQKKGRSCCSRSPDDTVTCVACVTHPSSKETVDALRTSPRQALLTEHSTVVKV